MQIVAACHDAGARVRERERGRGMIAWLTSSPLHASAEASGEERRAYAGDDGKDARCKRITQQHACTSGKAVPHVTLPLSFSYYLGLLFAFLFLPMPLFAHCFSDKSAHIQHITRLSLSLCLTALPLTSTRRPSSPISSLLLLWLLPSLSPSLSASRMCMRVHV